MKTNANFRFRLFLGIALVSFYCMISVEAVPPPLRRITEVTRSHRSFDDDHDDLDACTLPDKSGPCLALIPRYHFDINTGHCDIFTWGGCDGNANRFENLRECEAFGRRCLQNAAKKPYSFKRDRKPVSEEKIDTFSGRGGWSRSH